MRKLSKRIIGIIDFHQIRAWNTIKEEATDKMDFMKRQNAPKVKCYECKKEIPEPAWVQNYWCPPCAIKVANRQLKILEAKA